MKRIGTHYILCTEEMHPYTPICPVFSKKRGSLEVEFDAYDENDHFLSYHLSFITGHNFYVDEFIKSYDGRVGPDERFKITKHNKYIGTGIVATTHPTYEICERARKPPCFHNETILWDISSSDVVKCAYQVRLIVWDRTINGYGYIHTAEGTMHFSIEP